MALIWPATLPLYPLTRGYEETSPTLTIRTQMETGPPKVRKRFTSGITQIKCLFILIGSQTQQLDQFYTGPAAGGAEPYEWVHPRTRQTINVRFLSPPMYRSVEALQPFQHWYWEAEISVEVLPPGMPLGPILRQTPELEAAARGLLSLQQAGLTADPPRQLHSWSGTSWRTPRGQVG